MARKTTVTIPRKHLVTVPVTAEVIEQSEQRDSAHCMIADALRSAVSGARNISVDLATIRFTDRGSEQRFVYLTPPEAQSALIRFDQGETAEPFVFRLRAPVQVQPAPTVSRTSGRRYRSQVAHGVAVSSQSGRRSRPVIVGGPPLPANAVLSTGRGRVRSFGLKQLRP
jgi:hypothetical protein